MPKTAPTRASCSCGAVWHQAGNRTSHCPACHRTFSTTVMFDAHRTRDFTCTDPATMHDKNGAPRYKTFVDRYGATVWRTAHDMPADVRARWGH